MVFFKIWPKILNVKYWDSALFADCHMAAAPDAAPVFAVTPVFTSALAVVSTEAAIEAGGAAAASATVAASISDQQHLCWPSEIN